tara:strand:+ start:750 stop:926 length:177 start_codon:yes stop_codon:yes gene_type:complete
MKGKGTKYGQKVFGGQSVVGLKTARMIKKYKPVAIAALVGGSALSAVAAMRKRKDKKG